MYMARLDENGRSDGDPATAPRSAQERQLEEQLAVIITTARNVAVAAEELLRDVSQQAAIARAPSHAVAMAPRLLAATEQQLLSVAAMLRQG
jgi:hypothetical protein